MYAYMYICKDMYIYIYAVYIYIRMQICLCVCKYVYMSRCKYVYGFPHGFTIIYHYISFLDICKYIQQKSVYIHISFDMEQDVGQISPQTGGATVGLFSVWDADAAIHQSPGNVGEIHGCSANELLIPQKMV